MREHLYKAYKRRYGLIFDIGIETGLRISNIVSLPWSIAFESPWVIREVKTDKQRVIYPSPGLLQAIQKSESEALERRWLFESIRDKNKHVSRIQVYRVFNNASKALGLPPVATHSLRKTFAVRYFEAHRDLLRLQEILNHKYLSTTLLYVFGHLA